MPFADIGTTARKVMPQGRILRIWESTAGHCVLCHKRIDGTKATWYVEHIRALELGGADTDDNCGPAHYECKPAKDRADHKRAAEARHEKAAELGIPKRSAVKSRRAPKALPQRSATRPLNRWVGPTLERPRALPESTR